MANKAKTTYEFGAVIIPRNPKLGGDVQAVEFTTCDFIVLSRQQTLGM